MRTGAAPAGTGDAAEQTDSASRSNSVEDILGHLRQLGEDRDEVSVFDALDSLGNRGFGPFIFVPALIEVSPIGAIPGVPSLLAAIVGILAAQMLLGRRQIWMPDLLGRRSVSGDSMGKAVDKLCPLAQRLDRWFPGRLPRLTGRPAARLAAVLILLLCLAVPPLELVPFAASAPMAVIAMLGLALTLRDGVLMALGVLLAAISAAVGVGMLGGG